MKKQKYEPDDGPLTKEQLAHVKKAAKAQSPKGKLVRSRSLIEEAPCTPPVTALKGKVLRQRGHKLADLLADLPAGFEITDEMRDWMNMPEVGKEVWWRDGCGAGYLELAAKLRSYIPDGDGYGSDYAKTLASAADALESVLLRPIRTEEEYDRTVSLMNYLLDIVGDQEDHPLSGLLDLVSKLVASYDTTHFAIEASERWLHEPEMKKRLAQAKKWFRENPPQETSLNELEAKLKGR
jgi:hypothetical protein